MGHILSKNDEWFIRQNKIDPLSKQPFEEGDSVVVCRTCRCVQLEECWKIDGVCANCGETGYTTVFTKDTVVPPVIKITSKRNKKPAIVKPIPKSTTTTTRSVQNNTTTRSGQNSTTTRSGQNNTEVRPTAESHNGTLFALGIVLPIIAILFYAFCFYHYFPLIPSTKTLVIGVGLSLVLGYFYMSMEEEPYSAANGSYSGAVMIIMALPIGAVLVIWWLINQFYTPDFAIEYYLYKVLLVVLALANCITLRGFYLDLDRKMDSIMSKTLFAFVICTVIGYCAASYYFYGAVLSPFEDRFPEDFAEDYYEPPMEDFIYAIPNEYEYMMPYADVMVYSWDSLEGLDEDEVQFAINEIYAREGRIYLEEPYKSYFEGCSWYYGLYTAKEFDDSFLNTYERDNVELLVDYAKSKGYR